MDEGDHNVPEEPGTLEQCAVALRAHFAHRLPEQPHGARARTTAVRPARAGHGGAGERGGLSHLRSQDRRHRRLLGGQLPRPSDAAGKHIYPGERGALPNLRARDRPECRVLGYDRDRANPRRAEGRNATRVRGAAEKYPTGTLSGTKTVAAVNGSAFNALAPSVSP